MTKKVDFYFDFISPYSFIAHQKIKVLQKQKNLNINYQPILLGGLHKLGGITAPAFNDRKLKNMKNDCELVAQKNKIQFQWNFKFPINSLQLMRGYLVINDSLKEIYFEECFNSYWRDNLDVSSEKILNQILEKCEIDKKDFLNNVKNDKVKDKLKDLTQNAFDKNVFGAPTFIVNDKIFWGQDRLDYAVDEYYS